MSSGHVGPALILRRHVAASPDRVFAAWTNPDRLQQWWGPTGVECVHAEVDLRVGGRFRLANRQPDGVTIWISGIYETIDAPRLLVHTWEMGEGPVSSTERVMVEFVAAGVGTEVRITHTDIGDVRRRASHQQGWTECLAGLSAVLADSRE